MQYRLVLLTVHSSDRAKCHHRERFESANLAIENSQTYSSEFSFHIEDWPENIDINGRRVGVVGTGAAGVQLIEEIADKVKTLYIFQRTPNLALPRKQQSLAGLSDADFEAWSMTVADQALRSKDGSQYFAGHERDSGGYEDASKDRETCPGGRTCSVGCR